MSAIAKQSAPALAATTKTKATTAKKSKASSSVPAGSRSTTAHNHPTSYQMLIGAVQGLNERHGSTLQAIKKQIASQYLVDVKSLAFYIRKALKKAIDDGVLQQTKGVGANGSFKMASKKTTKKSKVIKKKPIAPSTAEDKKAKPKKNTEAKPPKKTKSPPSAKKIPVTKKKPTGTTSKKQSSTTKAATKNKKKEGVKVKSPKTIKPTPAKTALVNKEAPKPRKQMATKKN